MTTTTNDEFDVTVGAHLIQPALFATVGNTVISHIGDDDVNLC